MSAENKTKPSEASVDAFIDAVENQGRREDSRVLLPLFERITGEQPRMWGPTIVGFGSYHYKYASGREGDAPITGFSPRKSDLTVYLEPSIKERADLLERLGKHKMSVSCLYLKRLADVDLAALEQIVAESVRLIREKYPA